VIPVTEPLQAIHGTCSICRNRVWQVLLQNVMEGKVMRMWLKVDEVRSAGDESDGICGYHEHRCVTEAA